MNTVFLDNTRKDSTFNFAFLGRSVETGRETPPAKSNDRLPSPSSHKGGFGTSSFDGVGDFAASLNVEGENMKFQTARPQGFRMFPDGRGLMYPQTTIRPQYSRHRDCRFPFQP